jgi:LacI family transcriptional regulator
MALPRRERPEAIFAANDLLALGLLQSLKEDGRMLVPSEIALIGFDDITFAAAAAVPLSSIRQPSRMIGRAALRILLEETADADFVPRQTVFPPELVVRASTGG